MLGRTAELERIATLLRRADLVGVVLAGEAGVGKSSLLHAVAERAQHEGFAVVRLFGSRATSTLPLCAFSSLLDSGPTGLSVEGFVSVRRALTEIGGSRPLLIAIDDAHLLDDASAVLVSQLARELAAFVVCSVRSGEPSPEAISLLWVQGAAQMITIGPLPRLLAGEIAGQVLGGPVTSDLEAELWRRTAGNPLFVRELALGSLASGALKRVDGVWTQVATLVASSALVDLVAHRFAALTDLERQTMCAVALAEPAGVGLIEAVADGDALIGLEEAGLVAVTQDRRRLVVRLAHPVYGEVVRAQTSQLRARRIRRALADAVESFGARRHDDVLSMATWRLDCGDVDAAQFAAAAFDAVRRHDVDLAERLATAAHDNDPGEFAARALAMTRHLLGRHHEAVAVLEAPLAAETAGSAEWARLAILDGLVRARGIGDYPGATARLSGIAAADTTPRTKRRAEAMIALIELLQGDADAGRRRADALVGTGAGEAEAFTALVGATSAGGRPAAALAIADSFLAAHAGVEVDPRSLFPDFHWVAMLDAGMLDAMGTEVAGAWEQASDLSDRHRQARAALAMGHLLLDRGQATSARTWFETAAGFSRLTGERFGERWALSGRLLAAAQLGDVADAEAAVTELESIPSHPAAFFETYGRRGQAWLAAAQGEPIRARQLLVTVIDELLASGCLSHAVRSSLDLARLGDPTGAMSRLAAIESRLDGPALPAFVAFARALASSSADGLTAATDALSTLGYAALAAEAASAARDALARQGRARDASGLARRAVELFAQTEGGTTPMFTVIESTVPLTRREREVAGLVAAGRTSREVADACFLSVRTVETHLARIYDKLGVRTRGELAAAMSSMTVGQVA